MLIRGRKVMLDRDLAELYKVGTRNLNQAINRNLDRFPDDFMFQLKPQEFENLISHFGTSSWGGTRKLPRAFTEQGVAMLSSVLRSKRAVRVNIQIMRTFIKLKKTIGRHRDLARKFELLENKVGKHDDEIRVIFDVIRRLTIPSPPEPEKPRRRMGFHSNYEMPKGKLIRVKDFLPPPDQLVMPGSNPKKKQ